TGQAPCDRKITPVTAQLNIRPVIISMKPVRPSERCGVSSARKNGSSAWNEAPGREAFVSLMSTYYRKKMATPKIKDHPSLENEPPAGKRGGSGAKQAARSRYTKAEVHEIFRRFAVQRPEPKGELEHVNAFTLLVAVVLSAQATDAGVNKATRPLFAVADTPQKMLALGEETVGEYIRTIGLWRAKARNVVALSEALIRDHGGKVPDSREELVKLPGVGRKTANVVLNMA